MYFQLWLIRMDFLFRSSFLRHKSITKGRQSSSLLTFENVNKFRCHRLIGSRNQSIICCTHIARFVYFSSSSSKIHALWIDIKIMWNFMETHLWRWIWCDNLLSGNWSSVVSDSGFPHTWTIQRNNFGDSDLNMWKIGGFLLTKQAFTDFQTFRAMTCIFADFTEKTTNGDINLHQLVMQICQLVRSIGLRGFFVFAPSR